MVLLEQVVVLVAVIQITAVALAKGLAVDPVEVLESVEAVASDLELALVVDLAEVLESVEAVAVDLEVDLEEPMTFLNLAHLFISDYKLMVMAVEVVMECCKVTKINVLFDLSCEFSMHLC